MGSPGWYPDPTGTFEKRYWDGAAWTDRVHHMGTSATAAAPDPGALPPPRDTSPATPPPPPAPPSNPTSAPNGPSASPGMQAAPPDPDTVDDRYLWAIVAVPVLVGLIEMVAGFNPDLSTLLVVVAIGANTGLALLDIRANQKLAEDGSAGVLATMAALLMPVYVYRRQRILGRPLLVFWTYLVAFGFIIALQFVTGATNYIVTDIVEDQMESWGRTTFGVPVDVDCPEDQPARAGHRFVCQMSDGVDTVGVRVEVLNSSGDIEWEVLG